MKHSELVCPQCGKKIHTFRNPLPTVDIVIYTALREIVLIKRKNPPFGWALPGGFVDYGERVEDAALREAKEETGLQLNPEDIAGGLLGVYSDPERDPRQHTISVVYMARSAGDVKPTGGDDAAEAHFFKLDNLPEPIVFDHKKIIMDFTKKIFS